MRRDERGRSASFTSGSCPGSHVRLASKQPGGGCASRSEKARGQSGPGSRGRAVGGLARGEDLPSRNKFARTAWIWVRTARAPRSQPQLPPRRGVQSRRQGQMCRRSNHFTAGGEQYVHYLLRNTLLLFAPPFTVSIACHLSVCSPLGVAFIPVSPPRPDCVMPNLPSAPLSSRHRMPSSYTYPDLIQVCQ